MKELIESLDSDLLDRLCKEATTSVHTGGVKTDGVAHPFTDQDFMLVCSLYYSKGSSEYEGCMNRLRKFTPKSK